MNLDDKDIDISSICSVLNLVVAREILPLY